jgi:two-component system, NtrC family, nitrogen regulation response regulator NtrX
MPEAADSGSASCARYSVDEKTTYAPVTLVVDDDHEIRASLVSLLEADGHVVREAGDGRTALDMLEREDVDLLLLDLNIPRLTGLQLLHELEEKHVYQPTVIISGHGTIPQTVDAMRLGVLDFLEKPLDLQQFLATVRKVVEQARSRPRHNRSAAEIRERFGMVGTCHAMQRVYDWIDLASGNTAKVLILGETGTGKELVARAIHGNSARTEAAFVPLNCAALPSELIENELFGHDRGAYTGAVSGQRGRFEQAHRGTLFLDEIGDMSLVTQAKVLRALEDSFIQRVGGERVTNVDVRLIGATSRDLQLEVQEGRFREDLYYRLNVITIRLPPLRKRIEDIPTLVQYYFHEFCRANGRTLELTPGAVATLTAYPWPGNIRELRNVIERVVLGRHHGIVDAGVVTAALEGRWLDAPEPPAEPTLREVREHTDRAYIRQTLIRHGWSIKNTALELGINRTYLWRMMRRLGIEAEVSDGA